MKRKFLVLSATLAIVMAAASAVYAGSSLQLFERYGIHYIKHVNFNTATTGRTWLLIENLAVGDARVEIKYTARAVDGTNVGGRTFLYLDAGDKRTVTLNYSKPITDLNILQLIGSPWGNNHQ